MTKQTTITIETKSLLVLGSRSARRAWCEVCGAEVEVIAMESSGLSGQQLPAFAELLKSETVHRTQAPDGSVLICLRPLLDRARNTQPADRGIPQLPNSDSDKERT
jgi:hypothetical protein